MYNELYTYLLYIVIRNTMLLVAINTGYYVVKYFNLVIAL